MFCCDLKYIMQTVPLGCCIGDVEWNSLGTVDRRCAALQVVAQYVLIKTKLSLELSSQTGHRELLYRCGHLGAHVALGLTPFRQIMHLFCFFLRQQSPVASFLWSCMLASEIWAVCHSPPSEVLSQSFSILLSWRVSCVLCPATRGKVENAYSCALPTPAFHPALLPL